MDLIDTFTDAVVDAAKPNWKYNHYDKINFVKIEQLKKLERTDDYKENQVFTLKNYFKTELEENWYLPVINVVICGTVLETKVWRNNFWCEILDETGSIACVADIYMTSWNVLNDNYLIYHRKFRELEAALNNGKFLQSNNKFLNDYSVTLCMWLLFRKQKQIYKENYEIQMNGRSETIGKKISIYGQLKEMGVNRFISVKKFKILYYSSDESLFNKKMNNSY